MNPATSLRFLRQRFVFLWACVAFALTSQAAQAGSATWNLDPISRDWNTAANWVPNTVPNGPADIATFDISNTTLVSTSASTELSGIVFNAGASAFTVTIAPNANLTISGTGIANSSGLIQNFTSGIILFRNSAAVGSRTAFSNNSLIQFSGTSTAGEGTFTNNVNSIMIFNDNATAGTGTFITQGSAIFSDSGGVIQFFGSSTGGTGTFITNGATQSGGIYGSMGFFDSSDAGGATLIANPNVNSGGFLQFFGESSGGTARVKVFSSGHTLNPGKLDISTHNAPGVMVGSLEGDGEVSLGANNLTVGNNNLSTMFMGTIADGGTGGGIHGSLTKSGTGTLTLNGANSYTGGTTVSAGELKVSNRTGSGTGTGAVKVNAGTLSGEAIISGTVTIGTGSGGGAFLAPGQGATKVITLTIQSPLTFKADGTYTYRLKTKRAQADKVIAKGVTIENGAQFGFKQLGNKQLTGGTVFSVLDNTSANPIAGTFANLPDDSTFTAGRNTYQADYEGGDGNDLTLTVVP